MRANRTVDIFIISLALILSFAIMMAAVHNNNFSFTMDQGRDMVDIRHMVVTTTPRLVGPTTSINGVLLGPSWYYFLLPAFLLGGGNPAALVIWQIIWYQLSAVFLWWALSQKSRSLGLITLVLYLFMPVGFNINRYFWNANAMPIFTAFYFGSLYLSVLHPSVIKMLITGLLAGVALQIEAAFGIVFFPFAFLYSLITKQKFKNLAFLTAGFITTLVPQIIFELRHGFIMTRVFLDEFSGKASVLGGKITFAERAGERWQELVRRIIELSHSHPNTIMVVFSLCLLICLFALLKKKSSAGQLSRLLLSFLVFTGTFYLLFPQHLKGWYLYGLSVPLIMIIACAFEFLLSLKNIFFNLLVIILVSSQVIYATLAQSEYLKQVKSTPSNDPSNLHNQFTALDWVYANAGGEGFKAYNYIPSVYDYNYHYLYWWYGAKAYGYHPSEVAYLPNQPEYIRDNPLLWTKAKPLRPDSPIFLLIETDKEMPIREQKWLGNFAHLCEQGKTDFPFGLKAIKLQPCPK